MNPRQRDETEGHEEQDCGELPDSRRIVKRVIEREEIHYENGLVEDASAKRAPHSPSRTR